MKFKNLDALLKNDSGAFICLKLDEPKTKKTVSIRHQADPGLSHEQIVQLDSQLGHVYGLVDFFKSYSNLELFQEPISGDTAYYVASPESWKALKGDFEPWIQGIEPDEANLLPSWIENCCVVGERPGTGNYFLLATEGECSGNVFEFEHDGFYFDQISEDFLTFIDYLVSINEDKLSVIASCLRFVDTSLSDDQWYISEYKDNTVSIPLDRKGLGYRLRVYFTENIFSSNEKRTEVAIIDMPPPDSDGCSTIEYVEIPLPNEQTIALVCEMNKGGSSLSICEPSDEEIGGVRIGGRTLYSVYAENRISLRYSIDESTELFFQLAE